MEPEKLTAKKGKCPDLSEFDLFKSRRDRPRSHLITTYNDSNQVCTGWHTSVKITLCFRPKLQGAQCFRFECSSVAFALSAWPRDTRCHERVVLFFFSYCQHDGWNPERIWAQLAGVASLFGQNKDCGACHTATRSVYERLFMSIYAISMFARCNRMHDSICVLL